MFYNADCSCIFTYLDLLSINSHLQLLSSLNILVLMLYLALLKNTFTFINARLKTVQVGILDKVLEKKAKKINK